MAVTDGGWAVTDGGWAVTDGGWAVTDGGWAVTDGGGAHPLSKKKNPCPLGDVLEDRRKRYDVGEREQPIHDARPLLPT